MMSRQGFTLVELLLVSALAALVILAAGSALYAVQRNIYASHSLSQQQKAMERALFTLVEQLREAENVVLPAGGGHNPQMVELQLPAVGEPRLYQFGYDSGGKYLWLKDKENRACSHIASFKIELAEGGAMVKIELVSVGVITGIGRGLPLVLKTSVRLRN